MIYFNENEHEKYEHGTQQLKKIKQMCRRWAHLRISFWHLLVNLKNNYVFKKLLRWANEKCSFHAEWDGHNVLPFWPIFCPFTRLATQKIKILKWKNHLEMSSFYSCVSKITIMMYGSSGMECDRHNFLSSEAISCPFTQLNTCTNNLEN